METNGVVMTIPVWVLLAFAFWTLATLALTVGVYRWARILTGRASFETYGEYKIEGKDWYKRSLRAHANCIENLPVYGAIVVFIIAAGIDTAALDVLALVLISARVLHTLVHVSFRQTNKVVACRSVLFQTQYVCMVTMVVLVALAAA